MNDSEIFSTVDPNSSLAVIISEKRALDAIAAAISGWCKTPAISHPSTTLALIDVITDIIRSTDRKI